MPETVKQSRTYVKNPLLHIILAGHRRCSPFLQPDFLRFHRSSRPRWYCQKTQLSDPVSHNASEGVEPRNMTYCIGRGDSLLQNQYRCTRYGERVSGVPETAPVGSTPERDLRLDAYQARPGVQRKFGHRHNALRQLRSRARTRNCLAQPVREPADSGRRIGDLCSSAGLPENRSCCSGSLASSCCDRRSDRSQDY